MKAILEIEMDNAAFEPSPNLELSRILELVARHLKNCDSQYTLACLRNGRVKLYDSNGNAVGKFVTVGSR